MEPKRPTDTVSFRGRVSYAEIQLARDIAKLQLEKAEKQRTSAVLAFRDAIVYYARNEYPTAYKAYLVAVKGKARGNP